MLHHLHDAARRVTQDHARAREHHEPHGAADRALHPPPGRHPDVRRVDRRAHESEQEHHGHVRARFFAPTASTRAIAAMHAAAKRVTYQGDLGGA